MVNKIMPFDNQNSWLVPTVLGMLLSTLRSFRIGSEKIIVTILRFISHVFTCVFAGYVTAGILDHFNLPRLIAPCCALSGLYGTLVVDWIEHSGLKLVCDYFKSSINAENKISRDPRHSPPNYTPPNYGNSNNNSNDDFSDGAG